MKLTINLDSKDDCAVTTPYGTARRAIAGVAEELRRHSFTNAGDDPLLGICRDDNGNKIGTWKFRP